MQIRCAGAPSTDDKGIERIDLTHEYVRAVETCDLAYAYRTQIVQHSLEYSFLPGARLWASPDFASVASACQNDSIENAEALPSLGSATMGTRAAVCRFRGEVLDPPHACSFEREQRSCDFLRAKSGKWAAQ